MNSIFTTHNSNFNKYEIIASNLKLNVKIGKRKAAAFKNTTAKNQHIISTLRIDNLPVSLF